MQQAIDKTYPVIDEYLQCTLRAQNRGWEFERVNKARGECKQQSRGLILVFSIC